MSKFLKSLESTLKKSSAENQKFPKTMGLGGEGGGTGGQNHGPQYLN